MEVIFQCPHCSATIEADSEISGNRAECPSCEEIVLIPAPGIEIGTEVAGYKITSRLGVGGMGEVFGATQMAMDRQVALKILPPAFTADEKQVKRFLQEVRMAAKLEHPNVVTAFDAGQADGYYYLAMSLVDGEDLDHRLEREKRLPEKDALEITDKVASALDHAWNKFHMLHRDLKPANIMIDREGQVKLMDMGIAKSLEEDNNLTMQGMLVGTPYYISPEQATGKQDIDSRSDIYSLGATLYHLVCGKRPFDGPNAMAVIAKHITETPAPPRSLNSELSEETQRLIQRMMARDRDDRFADWGELREALASILLGTGTTMTAPVVDESIEQPKFDGDEEFDLEVDEVGLKATPQPAAPTAAADLPETQQLGYGAPKSKAPASQDRVSNAKKQTQWAIIGGVTLLLLALLAGGGILYLVSRGAKKLEERPAEIAQEESREQDLAIGDIGLGIAKYEERTLSRKDLDEMMQMAQDFAMEHPKDFVGIQNQYETIKKYAQTSKLPKYEMAADQAMLNLENERRQKRKSRHKASAITKEEVLSHLSSKAHVMASTYNFKPAIALFTDYQGEHAKALKQQRKALADKYRKQKKVFAPVEHTLRKTITIWLKGNDQEALRTMESEFRKLNIKELDSSVRMNMMVMRSLVRRDRTARPVKGYGKHNIDPSFLINAAEAIKQRDHEKALLLLNKHPNLLISQILIGHVHLDMLHSQWKSIAFAGENYTGSITSMSLRITKSQVALAYNGKDKGTGKAWCTGSWLYFQIGDRLRHWKILSIKDNILKLEPGDGVVITLQRG